MDSSSTPWPPATGVEYTKFSTDDEFDFTNCLDEELIALMGEDMQMCLFPQNNTTISLPFPALSSSSSSSSSMTNNIEGGMSIWPTSTAAFCNPSREVVRKGGKRTSSRDKPPWHTYDHNSAERKRRQHLNRHFIALSAIIPGLKKMDKSSILGDAITHMKYLQERVKSYEEELRNKSTESVVLVNKSQIVLENCNKNESLEEKKLPGIEARLCNTQILIKIQCEYRKGLLANLYVQLEKLNLTILNTYTTKFGMSALEITFTVQMEKEFNLDVNEVVKNLHAAIKHDL